MNPIRAVVVEDSLTVRQHIVDALGADPEIAVIGEAADGKTAIELIQRLRPDVVTLDMMLPVMTGLAVAEYVMAFCPTPILIVSASTNRGEVFKTYDALAAGAVDVLEKANGGEPEGVWEAELRRRVKLVARIKVITHLQGRLARSAAGPPASAACLPPRRAEGASGPCRAVGIGTSTGGPGACVEILRRLPADFPLPILLVIHIGPAFGVLLAEWLDSQSALRVACARDHEPLPPRGQGRVLLAPPERHLVVRQGRIRLTDEPERFSCRPSVDCLLESLARELGPAGVGCVLTGMGRDGAAGLLAMRQAGARTFAQDEATSVVFGMPQEAARLGGAERVLPLGEFAPALAALAGGAAGGGE